MAVGYYFIKLIIDCFDDPLNCIGFVRKFDPSIVFSPEPNDLDIDVYSFNGQKDQCIGHTAIVCAMYYHPNFKEFLEGFSGANPP